MYVCVSYANMSVYIVGYDKEEIAFADILRLSAKKKTMPSPFRAKPVSEWVVIIELYRRKRAYFIWMEILRTNDAYNYAFNFHLSLECYFY